MGGSVANPVQNFNEEAIDYADSVIDHTAGKYALLQGAAYQKMFANDEFGDLGRVKLPITRKLFSPSITSPLPVIMASCTTSMAITMQVHSLCHLPILNNN